MQDALKQVVGVLGAHAWLATFWLIIVIGLSFVARFLAAKALIRAYPTGAGFISALIQSFVIALGAYFIAINAGLDPTLILAILAIITAGFSLSADSTFKEILAGFKIVTSSKMRPGEFVTVADGIAGKIIEVGLNATTIESPTEGLIFISNHAVTEGKIINHSRLRNLELSVVIPMAGEHDRRRAIEIIGFVLGNIGGWHGDAGIYHSWTDTGERYRVVVSADHYDYSDTLASQISLEVTARLLANGFPVGIGND
jgi:small-conductance mechanosensitive channel